MTVEFVNCGPLLQLLLPHFKIAFGISHFNICWGAVLPNAMPRFSTTHSCTLVDTMLQKFPLLGCQVKNVFFLSATYHPRVLKSPTSLQFFWLYERLRYITRCWVMVRISNSNDIQFKEFRTLFQHVLICHFEVYKEIRKILQGCQWLIKGFRRTL